jgi:hypothetical protein
VDRAANNEHLTHPNCLLQAIDLQPIKTIFLLIIIII